MRGGGSGRCARHNRAMRFVFWLYLACTVAGSIYFAAVGLNGS